ncbi:pre-mRNA-splicing factor SLU7-like [Rhopilema esculentum]|uniref:pre-mRNA-splicing factor SLU7-like n=1 Tax=Rhopilema esculentum TaxID=499914 RepID=UPI0031D5502B
MASTKTEAPKDDKNDKKMSRMDWKKQKELEEARKAGTAPPEVDESGRDINPHIPQYIKSVPWYLGEDRPTLKHQRPQAEKQKKFAGLDDVYIRGKTAGKAATKFRKGACENCGAMTHKKKDCLERPRRIGAKFTGEDIKPDEILQPDLKFDYDGKRDRWAGYDVEQHTKIYEEYAQIDEAKRHLKAAQLEEDLAEGKTEAVKEKLANDDDEDEEKYAEEMYMPGQKFDSKLRTTIRNLRIREDTAKYLYNLDLNSAYYDPKTRSMRANPLSNNDKGKGINFYGDNWVRSQGDVSDMARSQLFAWQAYERGADVHLEADPTKLALLSKEFKVKKEEHEKGQKESIVEKYGGEEHLNAPPKELLLAQTEEYVEYSRTGKIVKGQEKAVSKSKYEEDVFINNHTSVWGSYWHDFQWGYACCHSFVKMSYCTGEAGKEANKGSVFPSGMTKSRDEDGEQKSLTQIHREKLLEDKKKKKSKEVENIDEDDEVEKKRKLKKALQEEEERSKKMEELLNKDERKRPYNSLRTDFKEPTEEEMEAYRMKRKRPEDPMSQFLSS